MQFSGDCFQFFYLCEGQFVICFFVLVGFVVYGMEVEIVFGCFFVLVWVFGNIDFFYVVQLFIE